MTTPALSIKGLHKVYPGGVTALRDVSLEVLPGEFFGLLGPNGAGKSTLIGVVSSLVRKSQGRVTVFGYDLERQPWEAKSNLGLVPQEFNFNGFETVYQILINQAGYYGVDLATARVRTERYLRELGLWGKRETVSRALSGGMKRRLMIARALVHEPRLLILDEPTAGVDIELRRSMWHFLRRINGQGTTIILTTHYLEEAESLCRRIAIIDQGRIIEDAETRELLSQLNTQSFLLDIRGRVGDVQSLRDFQMVPVDDSCLEVEVRAGQTLNQLFAALGEQGIQVVSMRTKANRLEELFVRLLEPGSGETAAAEPTRA